ncbi:MAG: class I SAM-dependent methyltransferase [Lysobacterales bacterium]
MSEENKSFFSSDEYYQVLTAHITEQQTSREVDFLEERLKLRSGDSVLDVGCGAGRHAIELSRRGYRVTAIDASAAALQRAHDAAASAGFKVEWIEGGNRALSQLSGTFDAAFSWQTSLGIYEVDGGDQQTIMSIARCLRPDGRLVLETTSLTWLLQNFTARDWRETSVGAVVLEKRTFDALSQTMHTKATTIVNGIAKEPISLSLRLYSAPEVREMVERAGLLVVEVHGGTDLSAYSVASRRLVITAVKP